MPFDDVKDVVLQSEPGKSGRPTYRLAMLTAEGSMPLSSGYGDTSDRCLALQSQILQLLRPGQAVAATAPAYVDCCPSGCLQYERWWLRDARSTPSNC